MVGSAREDRAMRDARVVTALLRGDSPTDVARREGVSREWVRRVVASRPGLREELDRLRAVARDEAARRVQAWSTENPELRVTDAVVTLGLGEDVVRDALGDRLALHTGPVLVWSDDQVREAVMAYVVAAAGRPTAAGYRAASRAAGWPSLGTVTARCGSWRQAVAGAEQALRAEQQDASE